MRFGRSIGLSIVGMLLLSAAFLWWLPASVVWYFQASNYPGITIKHVSGSLWHGQARGVHYQGHHFGTVHWTLSRRGLWGHWQGRFDVEGKRLTATGYLRRKKHDMITLHQMQFRLQIPHFPVSLWQVDAVSGQLAGHIDKLEWGGYWPQTLQADVHFNALRVHLDGHWVDLGSMASHWYTQQGHVMTIDVKDTEPGPLQLTGKVVMTPLGWSVNARVKPRKQQPELMTWLEHFGRKTTSGQIQINERGGLAHWGNRNDR